MSCVNLLEPLFPFDLLSFLSEQIHRSYCVQRSKISSQTQCVRFSYKLVWKRHSYWKQNLGKFGAFFSIYRRRIWPPAHLSVGSFGRFLTAGAFGRRLIRVRIWPPAHLGAFGCAFDRRHNLEPAHLGAIGRRAGAGSLGRGFGPVLYIDKSSL